jgi:hypothetical protein
LRQLSPLEKNRGEQLAQFLNGTLDKYGQISELLEWCQQLRGFYENRPPLTRSPERIAYERQRATLLTHINKLVLCKYQVIPRLDASEQGLAIGWEAVLPVPPEEVQALRAFKSDIQPISSLSAVMVIIEMTVSGTVDRIRRCDNPGCHKWIMVTNSKRVTCSDACRFAKYQQKSSRANDMRKSRELHKNHPHVKRQSSTRPTKAAKKGGR